MKKRIALALLTLALLATPLVYVACPESHAADGSTPWPGLYIGESYRFELGAGGTHYGYVDGVVTGYKGNFIKADTNRDGQDDIFVNMEWVPFYQ